MHTRAFMRLFLLVALGAVFALPVAEAQQRGARATKPVVKTERVHSSSPTRTRPKSHHTTLKAQNLLGRRLSQGEAKGLRAAHDVGGIGRDGQRAGIGPDGRSNFTVGQLRLKLRLLEGAGFSAPERRLLLSEGVAGKFRYGFNYYSLVLTMSGRKAYKVGTQIERDLGVELDLPGFWNAGTRTHYSLVVDAPDRATADRAARRFVEGVGGEELQLSR